jgi:hypothetical protein
MPVKRRIVQGTYISVEAKEALKKEAKATNKFVTTVASEILERGAKALIRKAAKK